MIYLYIHIYILFHVTLILLSGLFHLHLNEIPLFYLCGNTGLSSFKVEACYGVPVHNDLCQVL